MVAQTDLTKVLVAADKKDTKDKKVPPLQKPGWDLVPIEEDRTNMEAMWGLVLPDAPFSDQGVGNYRTKWEIREVNDSRRCSKCRGMFYMSFVSRLHYLTFHRTLWQSQNAEFVLDRRCNALLDDRHIFPTPELVHEARSAVVLKCETGVSDTGDSELIRVTAIDYYSGEILIDSLVWPDQPMLHYNPRFSGIQPKDMADQFKERKTLRGREGARKALWKFIGPQTYVIMHQGHMDMGHLRWYHGRMVDTWELQKRMSDGKQPPEFKKLVKHLLGRQLPNYRGYASTLQDVMATRDLLRWHAKNVPQNLWTKPRVFTSAECHWHMTYDVLPGDTQIEVWWQILLAMRIFDD
ncbi:hypothetical protein N7488_007217 [Penicillium malachiteum]|nr:hypothetical protein N7488_007217 [Penicillium malachiteum]